MLSQNTVKFLRAYFDKHLQTTASENVLMKLSKIKNHSYGVLTCTLKKSCFQHQYQKRVKMFVFIQSRFSAYSLISASKNYSTKGLHFHPCNATSMDYFLQLLKITGYQEYYLFFKLIKHIFVLTGTFN